TRRFKVPVCPISQIKYARSSYAKACDRCRRSSYPSAVRLAPRGRDAQSAYLVVCVVLAAKRRGLFEGDERGEHARERLASTGDRILGSGSCPGTFGRREPGTISCSQFQWGNVYHLCQSTAFHKRIAGKTAKSGNHGEHRNPDQQVKKGTTSS